MAQFRRVPFLINFIERKWSVFPCFFSVSPHIFYEAILIFMFVRPLVLFFVFCAFVLSFAELLLEAKEFALPPQELAYR